MYGYSVATLSNLFSLELLVWILFCYTNTTFFCITFVISLPHKWLNFIIVSILFGWHYCWLYFLWCCWLFLSFPLFLFFCCCCCYIYCVCDLFCSIEQYWDNQIYHTATTTITTITVIPTVITLICSPFYFFYFIL